MARFRLIVSKTSIRRCLRISESTGRDWTRGGRCVREAGMDLALKLADLFCQSNDLFSLASYVRMYNERCSLAKAQQQVSPPSRQPCTVHVPWR